MGENKPELVAMEKNPEPVSDEVFYSIKLRTPLANYIKREIDIAKKAKIENKGKDNIDDTFESRLYLKKLDEISAKFTPVEKRIGPEPHEHPFMLSDEEYKIIRTEVKNRFPENAAENRVYTEMMGEFETKYENAKTRKGVGELANKLRGKLLGFKPK